MSSSRESASSRAPSAMMGPPLELPSLEELELLLLTEVSLAASSSISSDKEAGGAHEKGNGKTAAPLSRVPSAASAAARAGIGWRPGAALGVVLGGEGGDANPGRSCCRRRSGGCPASSAPRPLVDAAALRTEEAGDRGGIQTPQVLIIGGSMVVKPVPAWEFLSAWLCSVGFLLREETATTFFLSLPAVEQFYRLWVPAARSRSVNS